MSRFITTDNHFLREGDLICETKLEGILIPQADILIAGIAKSNNLVLVTNNVAHFERIPNLAIENWHEIES